MRNPKPRWPGGKAQRTACPSPVDGHVASDLCSDKRPRIGKPTPWPALAAFRMDRLRFAHIDMCRRDRMRPGPI